MPNTAYYTMIIKKIGVAFAVFFFLRIIFVLFNAPLFHQIKITYFLAGLRFDAVSVTYLFLPFVVFAVIPLPASIKFSKPYFRWINFWYWTGMVISIVLNLIDVAYFRFTLKRTTADVIKLFTDSTETWSLIPMFLLDYWYLPLLAMVLIYGVYQIVLRIDRKTKKRLQGEIHPKHQIIALVISGVLIVLGMRGGIQHKPITIINAGEYAAGTDVNIVLNTPFSLLKTILEEQLTPHRYFTGAKEMRQYFNPVKNITPYAEGLKNKNVVIFILESFGKEYISYFNPQHRLTPFLDSLFAHSAVFSYSYANGRKSIEALPAIFSSIPALMHTPFIVSNYAGNTIESLPAQLKQQGYSTHFFHGGKNGTMNFDGFSFAAGITHYYGFNEYPEQERDYDGNWGIFDEPYLQYTAGCLDTVSQPFFATVFTLSSHHPFTVPKQYAARFTEIYNDLEISPTISYTDYALRRFFARAKQSGWFENTIFIITADHTSISKHPFFKNPLGVYNVPIVFYSPGIDLSAYLDTSALIQHIDLYPTVLSLLGQEKKVFSFGDNVLDSPTVGMNFLNGVYRFTVDSLLLHFDGEKITQAYRFKQDSLLKDNVLNELSPRQITYYTKTAQAVVQTYDESLLNNTMTADE